MKLIYFTDIHDARKPLRTVLEKMPADLYVVCGDLIYKAFLTEDKLFHFVSLQESLYVYMKQNKIKITPYELCSEVLREPQKYPSKLQTEAAEYRLLYQKASYNMKSKYAIFRQLFLNYSQSPVISIPGNYDMDLRYTAMQDIDLHLQSREYFGLKFSGYGGAPVITSGIPDFLSVVFHEYKDEKGNHVSEPYDFFSQEKPDIVVVHNPAYGRLDSLAAFGCVGSQGIRNYVDEASPLLVLSGHVHEDCGLMIRSNVIFLNPANFGAVENVFGGEEKAGYFCEIEFLPREEKLTPLLFTLFRLVGSEIVRVAEVEILGSKQVKETIFSKENTFSFGGFLR